ncbi:Uu.00g114020.m01.CDS01 [Anthostomella pinea]|uniref:Uu.00g114020.m01.CDS01 n=1 Tax=Anthostomella pinea TaxID=933095 RepID=A0AAI8VFL7_9PEZI|nr:Uu.00g114020.m01.CDS01 [Anthostomella pinea]
MENYYKYPVDYSEDISPKYPDVQQNQAWLEVVPNQAPLYPLPAHIQPIAELEANSPVQSTREDNPNTATVWQSKRRRVLGLTVPLFWTFLFVLAVILAVGIGGGVGGALKARRSPTRDTSSSPPIPSDGGCPRIQGQTYTPHAVNGQPIPLEAGAVGQQFQQQCWTNYPASPAAKTHDILRIYMPTLEDCMMACAEYNWAYRAGLRGDAGVGGGYCIAVSIVKAGAGFCYLKNGTTGGNDTMGRPDVYSSAVLITNTTDIAVAGS